MIQTKKCSVCGQEKTVDRFWSKRSSCISCSKAKDKQKRELDPDGQRERKLIYYYNITSKRFQEMWDAQDGKCAICSYEFQSHGEAHIDHDHKCCPSKRSCGKCLRMLLCSGCNTAIGLMDESIDRLFSAISYILLFS